jgi:hypothetical protein
MSDHQLSTRDLAARSNSDEPDNSPETQQSAERTIDSRSDQDAGFQSSQTDPSLPRDPADAHRSDTSTAGSGIDSADGGGGNLDSGPGEAGTQDVPSAGADHQPLFATDQSERFTSRWREIQTSFVDQPREAVAEADALVADLMQRLAASFSQERERLEAQWDRGDDVSTEDLRVALTRYRSFFDRLLSA